MKKIVACIITLCLLCSLPLAMAENEAIISVEVPASHTIAVEGENASVVLDEQTGDTLQVERLSSPTLEIRPQKGYVVTKVVYDGVDVTDWLVDGRLTVEGIFKDTALVVETEKLPDPPVVDPPVVDPPEDPPIENPPPATGEQIAFGGLLLLALSGLAAMLSRKKSTQPK